MKTNYKKINFRLEESIYNNLKELSDKYNISMNLLINEILKSDECIEIQKKLKLKNRSEDLVEFRFFIPKDEYEIFRDSSNKFGYKSPTSFFKFLIKKLLYKDMILNNIEIDEIKKTKTSINKLGNNLNMLLKELYKKEFGIDKDILNSINQNAKDIFLEIEKFNENIKRLI